MCRQTTHSLFSQTTGAEAKWEKKRVRTVIQGGQGRAQERCRLQGLGTGDLGGWESREKLE